MPGDAASGRRILGGCQRMIAGRDGAEDVDDVDGHEHEHEHEHEREREHENDAWSLPPAGVPTWPHSCYHCPSQMTPAQDPTAVPVPVPVPAPAPAPNSDSSLLPSPSPLPQQLQLRSTTTDQVSFGSGHEPAVHVHEPAHADEM